MPKLFFLVPGTKLMTSYVCSTTELHIQALSELNVWVQGH